VPIVAVMLLQAGPGEIGLLSTAQTLPFLLLSIPMGVLADRWSRSRLMVLAETARALSLLALWWMVGGGAGEVSPAQGEPRELGPGGGAELGRLRGQVAPRQRGQGVMGFL
jgi:MFS family permease